MHLSLIIARKRGEAHFSVLQDPGNPDAVNKAFKARFKAPGEIVEMQLWTNHGGMTKRKRFASTNQPPSPADDAPASEPPSEAATPPDDETAPATGDDGPSLTLGDTPADPKSKRK